MDTSEIYKGLEKHQGKWMAIHEGKVVVAPTRDKLYLKVPAKYKAKQIPHMFQGALAWRTLMRDALTDLMRQDEQIGKEEVQQAALRAAEGEEVVEMDLETEELEQERPSLWQRLFGRKKEETPVESFSE